MNVEPRIYDRALNQSSSVHATVINWMELDLHRQREVWTLSVPSSCSVKALRMVRSGGLSGRSLPSVFNCSKTYISIHGRMYCCVTNSVSLDLALHLQNSLRTCFQVARWILNLYLV